MYANARYTNTTTLHVYFDDPAHFAPNDHFDIAKLNIYNATILLDGVVIDTIAGSELQHVYDYDISPERHELTIRICGKNNVTQEYVFSNNDLELGRGTWADYYTT